MSKHYMLKLVRKEGGYHTEKTISFPEYMSTNTEKCLERFHQYATEIGFTNREDGERYQGGTVYRNPNDMSEVLRFR
jgi:hypothetical protein